MCKICKVETKNAPAAIGPYSQAVSDASYIFLSGQLPINYETNTIPTSIAEQTKQSLNNIKNIVESTGYTLDNVVKTTIFTTKLEEFETINKIYGSYFKDPFPARSCIEVSNLPKNALIEIECIIKK